MRLSTLRRAKTDMQLREIQIWGFGALANVRVRGLSPGLNVLHGPNEYGKTTLLEFVRRLLFGFPPRTTKANPYPALYSDRYGGQLLCEMVDRRLLTVTRTAGKGGGTLAVSTQNGETIGETEFAASLGYVSSSLYQNVFSIGLQELYEIDVMNLDEVKNRVYGAGLGGVSVTSLRERFEKRAGELYTKGGQKQRMKQLAAGIAELNRAIQEQRSTLSQYDTLKAHHDKLQQRRDALTASLPEMETQLTALISQQRLFPTFTRMQQAEAQSHEMGELFEISDDALVEMNERINAMRSLSSRIEEMREQLQFKCAEHDRIIYDQGIIACAADVKWLSRNVSSYRSASQELPLVERDLMDARSLINRGLTSLGEGWTADAVRDFSLTAEQEDALRKAAARLEECTGYLTISRQKLELHRDSVRASRSRQGYPGRYRLAGLAVAALAGAACILAVLEGNMPIAILSGLTGVLIAAASLRLSTLASNVQDPTAIDLQTEVEQRLEAVKAADAEWRSSLESVRLPSSLSPAAKDDMLRRIDRIATDLRRIDALEAQCNKLRKAQALVDERYSSVVALLGEPSTNSDITAQIEKHAERLDKDTAEKVRKDTLQNEIRQRKDEVRILEEHLEIASSRLQEFLAAWQAASAEELRERHNLTVRKKGLQKDVEDCLRLIEDEVGAGDTRDEFLRRLAATNIDEVRLARAELEQKIHQVQEEITSTAGEMGALDTRLEALASTDDLILQETELETLKQQLQDAYREWLTARLALKVIDAAVSRYEEERQPAVIRFAQTAFATMTGGRYERLLKPLEGNELHLHDTNGERKTVGELSRGTREQLYLAMRLGLIEQYEQNAEPLPVIMDDLIVNFDDARGPLAVETLAEFARNRQVIVMTCHESTRQLYHDAGATELTVREDSDIPA